ncbi:MAG: type II toxin-antitoxin system HicA family toxin [Nitrospirae bacterium]|nr:type II toxin-antitoxin system HicA family toxin [Nitrospirota bacterium]
MAKQPVLSGKELCSILEKEGFECVRQTGSHKIYRKMTEEGVITVPIPVHSNKPLKKGTLHAILKKTGITAEKLIFLFTILHSL